MGILISTSGGVSAYCIPSVLNHEITISRTSNFHCLLGIDFSRPDLFGPVISLYVGLVLTVVCFVSRSS